MCESAIFNSLSTAVRSPSPPHPAFDIPSLRSSLWPSPKPCAPMRGRRWQARAARIPDGNRPRASALSRASQSAELRPDRAAPGDRRLSAGTAPHALERTANFSSRVISLHSLVQEFAFAFVNRIQLIVESAAFNFQARQRWARPNARSGSRSASALRV